MKSGHPDRIDPIKLAQAGQTVSGQSLGAALSRWAESSADPARCGPVDWSAHFELRTDAAGRDVAWMNLQAQAGLQLVCQRCLLTMDWHQHLEREYRFVATESQALELDSDTEEDLLALDQALDLLALVEDELIMDLPMVPMHEVCPKPVRLATQTPDFEEAPPVFSALASLKDLKKD